MKDVFDRIPEEGPEAERFRTDLIIEIVQHIALEAFIVGFDHGGAGLPGSEPESDEALSRACRDATDRLLGRKDDDPLVAALARSIAFSTEIPACRSNKELAEAYVESHSILAEGPSIARRLMELMCDGKWEPTFVTGFTQDHRAEPRGED